MNTNGQSPSLRASLEAAGGSMKSVTVLAPQNDPFRVDTPAGHRDGAWLRDTLDRLKITGQRHLRGLHYILIGQPKPNGEPYINTDKDWLWLAMAAKAARWNKYISFDRIVDQRNAEPVICGWEPPNPRPYVWVDFEVTVPDVEDLTPQAGVMGFTAAQSYHLVLVGEKSSLRPVLESVAGQHQADLYLPTGEISDTQAYMMARAAIADGRPMVVLYFADCDPSGWQMPISLSRKLQGLRIIEFDNLEWQIHRVGLLPEQVREYGLPSTPLKDTERRADKWVQATGVEQTEIDALAALQSKLLRQIANDAIAPFYDHTLNGRVRQAISQWRGQAQQILDENTGDMEWLRADVATQLAEKRDEIRELLDTVRVNADELEFDLPPTIVPSAVLSDELPGSALCDSRWSFTEQCQRLIASKNYTAGQVVH
jgi:hypothetical protein